MVYIINMPENIVENNQAQMRKGTLEFCVLLIISKEKVYATDIINELKDAEVLIVEGTLYPLNHRRVHRVNIMHLQSRVKRF
jgi:PadR family transcriptional regulator PadR